jgi:RNA polymerase sigma-70 factor (ECF subfamily)
VPTAEIQDWQLAPATCHPSSGLGPADTEVLEHLPDARITRALRQLSEGFRTAVYLADVEGYAYREIATITETPIGTVTSRLRYPELVHGVSSRNGGKNFSTQRVPDHCFR